jgi:mannosylglycerate hydrolase
LAEYEATFDGTVFVTLVRAVGELSRNDIPERPGHAGWPEATPLAQSFGPFEASLALLLHGPRDDETIDEVERAADDVLLPLAGETLRSALRASPPTRGVSLVGEGLAFSALKESDDGTCIVARCVNLFDHEVVGGWRFGFDVRDARRARLDETPLEPLEVNEDSITFRAGPREVVSVRVTPK